eukprot:m.79625 g.79625  ORF g.79625 m.79625 type:complete len:2295 (+) comp9306_c0_seq2:357-7241(+)
MSPSDRAHAPMRPRMPRASRATRVPLLFTASVACLVITTGVSAATVAAGVGGPGGVHGDAMEAADGVAGDPTGDRSRRQSTSRSIEVTSSMTAAQINALITSTASVTTVTSVSITGSTITSAQLDALLDQLTTVTGDVQFTSVANVNAIEMPNVTAISGALYMSGCGRVRSLDFGNLETVGGALTLRLMSYLTASAISAGFPDLTTVGGALTLYRVSWSGVQSRSALVLPELTTVGSWSVNQLAVSAIACPSLTTVSGGFSFTSLPVVHGLDFPLLTSVSGRITINSLGILSNLCHFNALTATGYTSSSTVSIVSSTRIVEMPAWMATSSGYNGTSACTSGLPTVTITTAAELAAYASNSALTSATALGPVVLAYPALTNANLTFVLSGKTSLGALTLSRLNAVTDLTAALANVSNVTSGILVDSCAYLVTAQFQNLSSVGGGLRLNNNARMRSVSASLLTTVGGDVYLNNMHALTTVDFGGLDSVDGSLYLISMRRLSGDAISVGFEDLRTVNGTFYMRSVSTTGSLSRSSLALPELESIGAWFMQSVYLTAVGCPVLTRVGDSDTTGNFYWRSLPFLRTIHMPSLTSVSGRITLNSVPALLNLCHLGLELSGYGSSLSISIVNAPQLVQVPAWVATNASLTGTTVCSNLPGILIASQSDYLAFTQNTTLMDATELGSVVVTWSNMTNQRMETLFTNKTTLGGLVLALLPSVTRTSPALDNVTTVYSGVVADNMLALINFEMTSLTYCGSAMRIFNNRRLQTISVPQLTTVGVLDISRQGYVVTTSFQSLVSVNGSMTLFNMRRLTPYAISNGFPSLVSVTGRLRLDDVARWTHSPMNSRGPVTIPLLTSVGNIFVRNVLFTSLSMDALDTVAGDIFVNQATRIKAIHMPSLRNVTGSISLLSVPQLPNLCHIGLPDGNSGNFTVTGATTLQHVPTWIATNASLNGTTECQGLPPVVIHSQADFTAFSSNTTLTTATQLGQVVVTWSAISNTQLATIFQGKTVLGGVVIEGCVALTSLSPAMDNVTTVDSLVVDTLRSLRSLQLPALTFSGSSIRIYNNNVLASISIPLLTSAGDVFVYNCQYLRAMSMTALTSVNGTLSLSRLSYLSGSEISDAFPALQTIQGRFYVAYPSIRLPRRTMRAPISLPQLQSVGSWVFSNLRTTSMSCPALVNISGVFSWRDMPYLRALHFPSLQRLEGQFTLNNVPVLSTLCHIGSLSADTYLSADDISITRSNAIVSMPAWMATNASVTGVADCSGLPAIVISSQNDFNTFTNNATLVSATELGPVVITWQTMTTSQLATVLQTKTRLGGLVMEGCLSVTSLSPALDSVVTLDSDLVLDNLLSLTDVDLPNITTLSGGVRIYTNPRITEVNLPLVTDLSNIYLYNCRLLDTLGFDNVTNVTGPVTLRSLPLLTGDAITDAFPSLEYVGGTFQAYLVSYSGTNARSPLTLPALTFVGGMYMRQTHFISVTCSALVHVGSPTTIHDFGGRGELGVFYWNNMANLRHMDFPSLRLVSGRITIVDAPMLTNLCGISSMIASDYHSRFRVSMSTLPDLTESPAWIVRNASFTGTTECTTLPSVVIASEADYNAYMANTTLSNATELGPVVITWSEIHMNQLANVLQNKTRLGSLVMEGCNEISSLSPAFDNVTTVTAGVVLDNLVALTSARLRNVQYIGGSLRIYRNRRMTRVTATTLRTTGGLFLYDLGQMISASFDTLSTVNGSMTVRSTAAFSGTAVTNAFPRLTSVEGRLMMYGVSTSTAARYTAMTINELESVGALYMRSLWITNFSAPNLTTVGGVGQTGQFFWYSLPRLSNMSMPRLSVVRGTMTFNRLSRLTSLCNLGLSRSGLLGSSPVVFYRSPLLLTMPYFYAISGRLSGTSQCAVPPPTTPAPLAPPSGPPTAPTLAPTAAPTYMPTLYPTAVCNGVPDAPECSNGVVTVPVCTLVFASLCPGHCPDYCTDFPTPAPTALPTPSPTEAPTDAPTPMPTFSPTDGPTNGMGGMGGMGGGNNPQPTLAPVTNTPSNAPSDAPTRAPSDIPTHAPTDGPTRSPTPVPTFNPTQRPNNGMGGGMGGMGPRSPTMSPTLQPNGQGTGGATGGRPLGGYASGQNGVAAVVILLMLILLVLIVLALRRRAKPVEEEDPILRRASNFSNPLYDMGATSRSTRGASINDTYAAFDEPEGDGDYAVPEPNADNKAVSGFAHFAASGATKEQKHPTQPRGQAVVSNASYQPMEPSMENLYDEISCSSTSAYDLHNAANDEAGTAETGYMDIEPMALDECLALETDADYNVDSDLEA